MDQCKPLDVGGGSLYWAAGCLDAGICAPGNDNDTETDFRGKAVEARASCAETFASYPDVLACLEAGTYTLPLFSST